MIEQQKPINSKINPAGARSPSSDLLDEFLSKYRSRLAYYIDEYRIEKKIEITSGDAKKTIQYAGSISGLQIALSTIDDIENEMF